MDNKLLIKKDNGQANEAEAIRWLKAHLAGCRNGQYWLELKRVTRRRTIDQNALMWKWFNHEELRQALSEAYGFALSADDVHDFFCLQFLGSTQMDYGNGQTYTKLKGTSGLTVEEFTTFLNNVHSFTATEFGIQLPTLEEASLEEISQKYF